MLISPEEMAKRLNTSVPSLVRKFGRREFYEVADPHSYTPTPNILKAYKKLPKDSGIIVANCGHDFESGRFMALIVCTCGHRQWVGFNALSTITGHDAFIHMPFVDIAKCS